MKNIKQNNLWNSLPYIMNKIPRPGILLVVGKNKDKKNVMTIGWLQFGYIWEQPVISIMVRPSRHSYKFLQEHDEFTINVMPKEFNDIISICGSKSGSYCDKFEETKLETISSKKVSTVSLKDANIILECKILHKNELNINTLNDLIIARYYANDDYHQNISANILNIKMKENIYKL